MKWGFTTTGEFEQGVSIHQPKWTEKGFALTGVEAILWFALTRTIYRPVSHV